MVEARELRFCFVVDDLDAALHLYRDVFGLEVLEEFDEQAGRGVLMKVPEATLELVDVEHGGMVDEVEVGRRIGDRVRIAVKVTDLREASRAVAKARGEPMGPPVDTPWGDRNQRFRARDGLQVSLFQSP